MPINNYYLLLHPNHVIIYYNMSEEKKVSVENLDELINEENESSALSFQNILAMVVLNWQWFLLSLIICVSGALIYLRYTEPVYSVSARMLIKDEQNKRYNRQALQNMENLGFMTNSTGIENEMEILQSRVLVRDVVKDLKLYTEYRTVGRIMKPIIYGNQPINVDIDPIHLDSLDKQILSVVKGAKMSITRKGDEYIVDGAVLVNGKEDSVFTRKFKSLPASFPTSIGTLTFTRNVGEEMKDGSEYRATIRPPMIIATRYLNAMSIAPTSKLTSIAEITLNDKNIRRGMDFLSQLAICYNRQANADKNEIAMRTEEFINERISKINAELGSTEGAIEEFKRRNAVTDLGVDASSSVQMSSQFSAQLSQADAQIQILDNLRDYVNNPKNQYQVIPSNVGMTDGTATNLINSYNQAVQDRNRLLKAASEQAPQVQTLTATIEELQSSIKAALLQARRSADINRQGIQSQYAKFQGKVSTAPIAERVLTQIGRQQDVKSGLYLMLLQKREENTISLAATADKGKLIDEPMFLGKVSPKGIIILLAALVLGALLPAAIIYLLSFFRYKIEGHEDLAHLTTMPIIADVAIASDTVKQKAGIVVQANKNNQIDEIFRSLRTNVQFMMKEEDKVILFTSSISGEGKTFVAGNLATSFAFLGKKVLLVGLDIRRPRLSHLFGMDNKKEGITTLLTKNSVSTDDVLSLCMPSGVNKNLDLLIAGPIPPNPSELLTRSTLKEIFDILRKEYDYVIVDTAPVGLVTDTLHIGKVADATVMVCRADYTEKSSFSMINDFAENNKLPNVSIVVNGVDMSKKKYGYAYGYGKYGKYGKSTYRSYTHGYGSYGYQAYGYGLYSSSHYSNPNDNSIRK